MFHFFKYLLIILIVFSSLPISLQAESLTPPGLGQVMKENEKLQRIQRVQSRFKKISPIAPVLTPDPLSHQTILTGKSVTLTKYNTIDLWVQEVNLNK